MTTSSDDLLTNTKVAVLEEKVVTLRKDVNELETAVKDVKKELEPLNKSQQVQDSFVWGFKALITGVITLACSIIWERLKG